jgi:hypothetical protein
MTDTLAVSYADWTREVFGVEIPRPGVLHAMSFQGSDEWNNKAHVALVRVELEYVELLLEDVKKRNVDGALVEFGIFEGWWINHLFEVSERLDLQRPVIGYDSFEGLSAPDPLHDSTFWKEGMYSAGEELVREKVKAHERPRIQLIKGFFENSLAGASAQSVGSVAYARIDCDIYRPALDCLRYLESRLSHGAVLVFDDWPHLIHQGEGLAFAEWRQTVPHLRFQYLFQGSWGHLYLRVWHEGKQAW